MKMMGLNSNPCRMKILPIEEFVWDNFEASNMESFRKRPKRYYSVDEAGNQIMKEFNLLEWVVKEMESRKFILKEDFIDELASQGIDVFRYNQEDYIEETDGANEACLKLMCILKAYWNFKDLSFFYTDAEIEGAFGIKNASQRLEEMVERNWINIDLLEGHPEIRVVWEAF